MADADDILISEEGGSPIVSDRVAKLAQDVYDEFQNIVDQFGPDAVQTLAPLVVNVLESLDNVLGDNDNNERDLGELTEKYELLAEQFEKEKHRRKEAEERSMQLEDASDVQIRHLKETNTTLVNSSKALHSKAHQQGDQIGRLMEENDTMKKEVSNQTQRHIEAIRQYNEKLESLKQSQARVELVKSGSVTESDDPPGFHDFMTPKQNKKRKLPQAPKQKSQTVSADPRQLETTLEPPPRPESRNSPEYQTETPVGGASGRNKISLAIEERRQARSRENIHEEDFDEEDFDEYESDEEGQSLQDILIQNEELVSERNELARELRDMEGKMKTLTDDKSSVETAYAMANDDNQVLNNRMHSLEDDLKRIKRELQEAKDKLTDEKGEEEGGGRPRTESESGGDGSRRLEWARLLKERNEFKEKYYAILDQVKLSDELSLFKNKSKKSKWFDYFQAMFSPAKRREMEHAQDSPHRRLLMGSNRMTGGDASDDEDDSASVRQPTTKKQIIPTLKRIPRREELLMSVGSWFAQSQFSAGQDRDSPSPKSPSNSSGDSPNISTCRPMSYQEEGAKVLCAASVNTAVFMADHLKAMKINKQPNSPKGSPVLELTISLLWVVTGVPNLSKVSVVDSGGVGDVLETFPVSSDPISCIASVPGFDDQDPEVLASVSSTRHKNQGVRARADRPSSTLPTMWLGSVSGILYVHSSFAMWKKCIHADKLPGPIVAISHLKGRLFVLMKNGKVAIFRRYSDGEWDFDNFSVIVLGQRNELVVTAMASVKFNVWCGTGNYVHVVGGSSLKMEAAFIVHPRKKSEITHMVAVGDGVWVSIKYDSTIRLFHASSFQHMQDLDISPPLHKILAFHSDRRLTRVVIRISTMMAAYDCLWIGTENGIILCFPFSSPTIVAEEAGWEVMKEAVVSDPKPEPLDVRIDEASDTVRESDTVDDFTDGAGMSCMKGERDGETTSPRLSPIQTPQHHFSPFVAVDQMRISVHCHVKSVKQLICSPGLLAPEIDIFEPLQKIKIKNIENSPPKPPKPALFIVSFGEGHLDLRASDKVIQTLNVSPGQGGLPSPSTVISDKNYIMVWEQGA